MSEHTKIVRREFVLRSAVIVAFVLILLLLVGLVNNGVQSRKVLREVRSCTNPTGECYQRNQESSGKAVELINTAVVCAAYYADRPGEVTEDEIRECIEDRIAERAEKP